MFIAFCLVIGMNTMRACFFLKGDMLILLSGVSTRPNIWDLAQRIQIKIDSCPNPKILGHPQWRDSYRLEEINMTESLNLLALTHAECLNLPVERIWRIKGVRNLSK